MSKFVSLLVWSKTNKLLTKKTRNTQRKKRMSNRDTKKKIFSFSLTIRKHKQKKKSNNNITPHITIIVVAYTPLDYQWNQKTNLKIFSFPICGGHGSY